MFVHLCCCPLLQGVVVGPVCVCLCAWGRQRCVYLVETCWGVPHCADTWHRALARTQTHTQRERARVCERRHSLACVRQHVVSVSALETHMLIYVEDLCILQLRFLLLMCLCMWSKMNQTLSLTCQKWVLSLKNNPASSVLSTSLRSRIAGLLLHISAIVLASFSPAFSRSCLDRLPFRFDQMSFCLAELHFWSLRSSLQVQGN